MPPKTQGTVPARWSRRADAFAVSATSAGARCAADLARLLLLDRPTAARFARLGRRPFAAAAPSSFRALSADVRRWAEWCASVGCRRRLPARPRDVAAFVDARAVQWRPATLARVLSSLARAHRVLGAPDPTRHEQVRAAYRAAVRRRAEVGHGGQRQAAGLTEAAVAAMLAPLGSRLIDCRDRALLLVARELLARRCELVALRVRDLVPVPDPRDGGATTRVANAKTDPSGRGAALYLGPRAYAAVRTWLRVAGITDGYPFRAGRGLAGFGACSLIRDRVERHRRSADSARPRHAGPLAMRPIVQISLDLTSLDEALATARVALDAGVDWLEAGTPLILAEGLHGVRALRAAFPGVPIVADLKTMDGGYLEAEMMARAGATHVVVMARAHDETVRCVVAAGRDFGVRVMGDTLACPDMVGAARRLEALGCDYVVHHVGYDERRGIAAAGRRAPSPLDQLREVVDAVSIPVQAVGGLTIEQAIRCPEHGAPLVVVGAPLAVDADAFRTAAGDLGSVLRHVCDRVHAYGDVHV